jgi:hypothetical protein
LCDGDTDCPDGSDESTQECGTKQECRTDQVNNLFVVVFTVVDAVVDVVDAVDVVAVVFVFVDHVVDDVVKTLTLSDNKNST